MKNPRIEDFDPEAKMRKLGSPLDGMPRIEKPRPQLPDIEPVDVAPQPVVSPPKAHVKNPDSKPAIVPRAVTKRAYIRRTFDFYEDQIAYLTKASLEERLAGGEGSMNAMVREAIDAFIAKRRKDAA